MHRDNHPYPDHDQERLRRLLTEYRDISPSPDFNHHVWRQLRLRQTEPEPSLSFLLWLRQLTVRPPFSMPVAVVVALVIGVCAAMWSAPHQDSMVRNELDFMAAGTLAGSYGQLIAGNNR